MPSWPDELYLITHAQCETNNGTLHREAGLTSQGQLQARELGTWFAQHEPRAVWASPFRCARETARIALVASGLHPALIVDERLALAEPAHILHDAGSIVDALRGCNYQCLALVTHYAVAVAISANLERVRVAGLLDRDRRECAITAYRREGNSIRRIA